MNSGIDFVIVLSNSTHIILEQLFLLPVMLNIMAFLKSLLFLKTAEIFHRLLLILLKMFGVLCFSAVS